MLLRLLFAAILLAMLAVTTWASLHTPLFQIPRTVVTHPWFLATLADAYFAFITCYVWVAWKEQSAAARVLWFLAILALGNIAMSLYILVELFHVPNGAPLSAVITSRRPGKLLLPASLTALSVVIYLLA